MATELWDILDENGNATGRVHERGKHMNKGKHHLEVSVWIENDNGEYLISKRSPNKTFPNMWECTGGNAVAGNDSLTTALKEVKEELGIVLEPQNGQILKHFLPCSTVGCHGLIDVWLFRQNVDISTVILTPDETCNVMWASRDKIKQMIDDGIFISEWYPYIDELFCYYDAFDVPGYSTFVKIEPIEKGWSGDKKYYVETAVGQHMLLRVSDTAEYNRKKAEYKMMERVYELGVLTPQPLGFGLCNSEKSVYSLSGWLDGEDAEKALPLISETEQYVLGLKAGETLRKIHTLPAPEDAEPWSDWFYRKVQGRIDFYNANPVKSENGDKIVRFLQDNKHLLDNRPQTFNHGDFNKSNLMVMPDGQIGVIDFNAYNKDHGDPWWEFDPTNWGNEPNAYFCTGLINGYFDGSPPGEFFQMHRYYLAYDALAALCDTSVGNQGEPEEGRRHLDNVLRWFDNMQNSIPLWYHKDF